MKPTGKPSRKGRIAEKALKMAVKDAIEEHRRYGVPLAVMHNGKEILISPEKAAQMLKEKPAEYSRKKKKN